MVARTLLLVLISFAFAGVARADGHLTMAPEDATVYFISPPNGAVLSNPFKVRFGLSGMGVAPAGIEKKNTGHHHLLIDTELADYAAAIPNDETHRHFGGGQTEVELTLSPGKHTLQLVVGDHNHIPHNPPIQSERITVLVK